MKRIVLSVAVLAGLAGCGPDCDRFCSKWVNECGMVSSSTTPSLPQCISACNDVGGDYAAFIGCVVGKSCDQLRAGACQIPAALPGFTR